MDYTHHTLPKVSIIVPTKNCWLLLCETIESISNQTYSNWEAIVVDDGSTDGTVEQMSALSKEEPRIHFLQRSSNRTGAPVCRNEGFAASTGDYVIFLDSDDCLAPYCLENRVKEMEAHRNLDFGVFPCQLFRKQPGDVALLWNAETQESDIDRLLRLHDVPWQTTSPIWRSQALHQLGLWDESLLKWQDWEFHFRALFKGLKYKKFTNPDCFWRMREPFRETVSSSWSPQHIRSLEQLLSKVYSMLLQAQMLTEHRRYPLASLYFWLANKWVPYNEKEAERVWTTCWEKKLIGNLEHWEGLLFFRMRAFTLLGYLTKQYLKIRWPRTLLAKRSPTFQNTHLTMGKS